VSAGESALPGAGVQATPATPRPRVREVTRADLDAVVVLEACCFPGEAWTRAMLDSERDRPGGVFLVAELDGRCVGYGVALRAGEVLEVLKVAVDPDVRRAGVGRALVGALHAAAGWAEAVWLEVRVDNVGARTLYESCGYVQAGRRKRYYADGTDALVLRRDLGQ
jgi:ribosomal-protein-alanine N-acetyltransferase